MYTLTPIVASHIEKTLSDTEKVHEWLNAFGSPLNLVYPTAVVDNYRRFKRVLQEHKIKGEIFYAHKANKSVAVVKQLAVSNAKVDVASEKELQNALSAGFSGKRIEATGPKNIPFLRLALLHNVILNVNSMHELNTIFALRKDLRINETTPIFIRLKEFALHDANIIQKDAKFGLNLAEARAAIEKLRSCRDLDFYGFSFHLATNGGRERILAIEQSLVLTLEAIDAGLKPRGINIGGGFTPVFLRNKKEWYEYVSAIKDSLIHPGKPFMSWNQSGMGYWVENGKLRGSARFPDFYRPYDQYQELGRVLSSKIPRFGTIGDFLQENMFDLYIEPGRSLLDQAGVTLARVDSVNTSLKGEKVVFLDMNRSQINAGDLEFMSDPIVISRRSKMPTSDGVFLSGNLCLPHDFICTRKVFLGLQPCAGDILAFVNTGGYFMDFAESETIQHPIAHKIAINKTGWFLDHKYEPEI